MSTSIQSITSYAQELYQLLQYDQEKAKTFLEKGKNLENDYADLAWRLALYADRQGTLDATISSGEKFNLATFQLDNPDILKKTGEIAYYEELIKKKTPSALSDSSDISSWASRIRLFRPSAEIIKMSPEAFKSQYAHADKISSEGSVQGALSYEEYQEYQLYRFLTETDNTINPLADLILVHEESEKFFAKEHPTFAVDAPPFTQQQRSTEKKLFSSLDRLVLGGMGLFPISGVQSSLEIQQDPFYSYFSKLGEEESLKRIKEDYTTLVSFHGRKSGTDWGQKAADYIKREFERLKLEPLPKVKASYPDTPYFHPVNVGGHSYGSNVLGMIPGRDPTRYIVISAHYDHLGESSDGKQIWYGADDNASGTSALLEQARQWAAARDAGVLPEVTLVFMGTTGEEEGLLGSRALLKDEILKPTEIVGDFNIDMVGRDKTLSLISSNEVSFPFHDAIKCALFQWTPEVEIRWDYSNPRDWNGLSGRSDQSSFSRRGIPAIFAFTKFHDDYHRTTDTADQLDPANIARAARVIFAMIREVMRANLQPIEDYNPEYASVLAPSAGYSGTSVAFANFLFAHPDNEWAVEALRTRMIEHIRQTTGENLGISKFDHTGHTIIRSLEASDQNAVPKNKSAIKRSLPAVVPTNCGLRVVWDDDQPGEPLGFTLERVEGQTFDPAALVRSLHAGEHHDESPSVVNSLRRGFHYFLHLFKE